LFDAVLTPTQPIQPIGQDLQQENQSLDFGPRHAMNIAAMQNTRQFCDLRQSAWDDTATHEDHIDELLLSGSRTATRIGWQEER
jgi:hypothetical protein